MIFRGLSEPHAGAHEMSGEPAIEIARSRLIVAGALFSLAFAVIAGRLVDLALLVPRDAASQGHAVVAAGDFGPVRAEITDRNGVLLATGLPTASLYANPSIMLDPGEAADRLVTVLPDLDRAELLAKLDSKRRFVWVKRHLTPREQHDVNRLGIPGLDFKREASRIYPMGRTASHVVGFTDIDENGLAGVESYFDTRLWSADTPLVLSLDVRIQEILRQELAKAVERFEAIGGSGVVLDVNTGEIIAMVSLPDFDPNHLLSIDSEALFNRNTLGVYEMGSTFKIFTTAMALDAGTTTMRGGYDARHPIRVARFVIRDYHGKRRWLSVPEIFMYSSNIGAVKMALDVGQAGQRQFLESLGFFRPAPVELPETGHPLVPEVWREINTMTISFGHGLSVSPLHLASGVAAIVNGGVYYPPTILKRSGSQLVGRRVISPDTSDKMRRLLRLVVEHGTGRKSDAEGYLVGGKTGTAEKVSSSGYERRALISSFVGAFPMTAPRYVVFAMLDEPKGQKETFGYATGGWVAAPVVKEVIRRTGTVLAVRPLDAESPEIERRMHVTITGQNGEPRLASY